MATIQFYPPELTDSDLRHVYRWAEGIWDRAPELASWLADVAALEAGRRAELESGADPREVELPRLPFREWDDRTLARTLIGLDALARLVDREGSGRLVDRALSACLQENYRRAARRDLR